jgi:hypothetical protein
VIISDLPTYNPGTRHHREIQIPVQWSDSQIVVNLNQGSFVNGQPAYLYVVDSLGRVSGAHPITINGGSALPPAPPANPHIVR